MGITPDQFTPRGSPLAPLGARPPAFTPPARSAIEAPDLQTSNSFAPAPSLPSLPPSARAKGPSIWDKQHISETLANISAGFASGQNFSDGLGAAAQTISGRNRQLRDDQKRAVSYGGPGDQFEISSDAYGNRSIREVPEFRAANERAAAQKHAPSAKDSADLRARALYAISTQVPPQERAAAYQRLITNPQTFGIDTTGLPAQWDDQLGTLGGMMGMTVDQSLSQERANVVAKDQMRHRQVQEGQADQRVQQGAARVAQGEARVAQGAARVAQGAQRLRTPPPSVRKPKISQANSDLSYLLK
jgi:hypothetical protein